MYADAAVLLDQQVVPQGARDELGLGSADGVAGVVDDAGVVQQQFQFLQQALDLGLDAVVVEALDRKSVV